MAIIPTESQPKKRGGGIYIPVIEGVWKPTNMTIKEYKRVFLELFAKMQEEHGKAAEVSIRHIKEENELYRYISHCGGYIPNDVPPFNEYDVCNITFKDC